MCALVEQVVRDKDTIPAFCPLTDFPARALADLESTVRAMQEPYKYNLTCTLMTHIAQKLKTTLSDQYVVKIKIKKDDGGVYLNPALIFKLDYHHLAIYFGHASEDYRIFPDSIPPKLEKKTLLGGSETPSWLNVELA